MINGAHVIIYSRHAEADRAFIRDVLGFPNVDAGGMAHLHGPAGRDRRSIPATALRRTSHT
jgi:hypothetical protein